MPRQPICKTVDSTPQTRFAPCSSRYRMGRRGISCKALLPHSTGPTLQGLTLHSQSRGNMHSGPPAGEHSWWPAWGLGTVACNCPGCPDAVLLSARHRILEQWGWKGPPEAIQSNHCLRPDQPCPNRSTAKCFGDVHPQQHWGGHLALPPRSQWNERG